MWIQKRKSPSQTPKCKENIKQFQMFSKQILSALRPVTITNLITKNVRETNEWENSTKSKQKNRHISFSTCFKISENQQCEWNSHESQLRWQWSEHLPAISSRGPHSRCVRRETMTWRPSWTPRTPHGPRSPIRRGGPARSSCSSGTQRRRSSRRRTDRRCTPSPTSDRRRAKLLEAAARPRPRSPPETPAAFRRTPS